MDLKYLSYVPSFYILNGIKFFDKNRGYEIFFERFFPNGVKFRDWKKWIYYMKENNTENYNIIYYGGYAISISLIILIFLLSSVI